MREKLRKKAGGLPSKPGVYIMMDKSGEVIYVGKAVSLKNRVLSYFRHRDEPPRTGNEAKTEVMVSKVEDFDIIVANSEFEALVLENTLIKHHMPRYNIRLRDDKGHPFIRVDLNEEYPRFKLASKRQNDGARYLGPYSGRSVAHGAIDSVSKAFMLPTCSRNFPRDIGRERPCINHQIGYCRGWCIPDTPPEDYMEAVLSAVSVFEGKAGVVTDRIKILMEEAAENLQFEKAAELRDRLKAVQQLTEKQLVISGQRIDTDAVGFFRGPGKSCFTVLHYIDGKLLDKDYELINTPLETDEEALSGLIRQYYLRREVFPRIILVQEMPKDAGSIEMLFSDKAGHKIEIALPRRGDKRKFVETAVINAREEVERVISRGERTRKIIEWLGKAMGIVNPPLRMEAFDISNTGDTEIVASMVVFDNGKPKKSAYKKFIIKSVKGQDDYHSMQEAVDRRCKRFADGDKGFAPLPDVFLIDGGSTHAKGVREILDTHGIEVPVFGMVKDNRHRTRALVSPDGLEIGLEANPAAFALIGRIQEETHRFAIDFHRKRRSKSIKKSILDEIPGIGPVRKADLLKKFGSIKRISSAELSELEEVVPKPAAKAIFAFFRQRNIDNNKDKGDGEV